MAFYSPKSLILLVLIIACIQDQATSSPIESPAKIIDFDFNTSTNPSDVSRKYRNRKCSPVNPADNDRYLEQIFYGSSYAAADSEEEDEEPVKLKCSDVELSSQDIQNAQAYTQYLRGLNDFFWQKGLTNKTNILATSGFHENLAVIMHLAKPGSPSHIELQEALGHSNLDPEILVQMRDYLRTLNVESSSAVYLPDSARVSRKIRTHLRNMNITITNSFKEVSQFVIANSKGHSSLLNSEFEATDPALINVMSFQLKWQYKVTYKPDNLIPFHLNDGTQLQVPMMDIKGDMQWYIDDSDQYFVVKLPFETEVDNRVMKLNGISAYVIGQFGNDPVPEVSRELIQKISKEFNDVGTSVITLQMPGIELTGSSVLTENEFSKLLKTRNEDFIMEGGDVHWKIRQESHFCMDDKGTVGGSTTTSQWIYLSILKDEITHLTVKHPYIILLALEETLEPIFVAKVNRVSTDMISCYRQ